MWNDSQNLNMPRLLALSDNLEDNSLKLNNYKKYTRKDLFKVCAVFRTSMINVSNHLVSFM